MSNIKLIKYENLNLLSEILIKYDLIINIQFNNKNEYLDKYNNTMIEKIKYIYKEDIEIYNSL